MSKNISGKQLADALLSGTNALLNAKNQIDALNVFPVPDGDTGTNMAATMNGARMNLMKVSEQNVAQVAAQVANDMLYEARGNSGVILSQIFKGFYQGIKDKKTLNCHDLTIAFSSAATRAYKAVFKPVEGTILSVIRETAEKLSQKYTKSEEEIENFFADAVTYARESCDNTPNSLKILKEVGVTDSGGEGLYKILWGISEYFLGRPVEKSDKSEDIANFISDSETYDGEFGYCTEFLIEINEPDKFDKDKFTKKIEKIANSLVIVQDDNLLKVHGHVLKPGNMLNIAQKHGEFIKIKSENMTLQANNSRAQSEEFAKAQAKSQRVTNAIISCNLGTGIIKIMQENGCDYIVEGGQTSNPSAQDLIEAIQAVNAENVFILPNNKNITLVAQQAAVATKNCNVHVIPTKTQIEGLTALFHYNPENKVKENLANIKSAIKGVGSGEVTIAVRSTKINSVRIKAGDYLAIANGKIIETSKNAIDAAKHIISKLMNKNREIVTIFYGDESCYEDAQEISNYINSKWDIEVEIYEGNQPNYHFLIGVE
ncbi:MULTISPECIES: DAK2 domain-containing protein [unclassified Mycoplasma]|uniref:DAK2 domain-containing protein n=1 Tax=unclassified Mycoplasma TaxID=2683645 RepID=UPI00211BEE97|nr:MULTISPECIES: DAK2 domain-containing protein [unclassified Mycoplasma]UUM19779.1 DAK2 domain-containing protein [Mycoplasma sp. 1578d]UUM24762.1 DAK2 domain-containing protein [Mycoplasma sp. 3686d]